MARIIDFGDVGGGGGLLSRQASIAEANSAGTAGVGTPAATQGIPQSYIPDVSASGFLDVGSPGAAAGFSLSAGWVFWGFVVLALFLLYRYGKLRAAARWVRGVAEDGLEELENFND